MKAYSLWALLGIVACSVSCSTTKHLPAGEQLYTGVKKIEVTDEDFSEAGDEVMSEIEAALAYPPNNALFGSSKVRTPFPFGLWMYNAFVDKPGKLNQWLFKVFAANPVLLSTVNPEVRVGIAKNLLREHGYFNGTADYEVLPHKKDSLKAEVVYRLTKNEPYRYDSVQYRRFRHRADTLIQLSEDQQLLHKGDLFNVVRLEEERQRIATLMRDNGYYYFRPDYIVYDADSTLAPQKVSLRVQLKQGLSPQVMRPWRIGDITVRLSGRTNSHLTDTLLYEDLTILYNKKLRVRPNILYNQFRFKPGAVYSQTRQTQTQSKLNQLRIFQYTEMQYTPKDSSRRNDVLQVNVNATYDLPLSSETEINLTANSNKRIGPGAVFSLTRNNLFRGGELLNIKLNGTYEWLYGDRGKEIGASMDNYEYGITGTLTFPRVLLPRFIKREYDFPASTTFQLYANRLNRADFFRMLSFGGSATYDFLPTPIRHHSFTPFRLSFNLLERTTSYFDSISGQNQALFQSLRDQFIPAISYTYTLDNSSIRKGRHTTWWQLSVTESGNLMSGAYALAGKGFGEEKRVLGNPFSQFLKLTTELRYNHALNRNHRFVGRVGLGAIYSYGNMKVAPYSEQFHVGGANSVRAFPIRSIGPGRFHRSNEAGYATLDHIGDLKLEANLEHRFNLVGNLEGAWFIDAGNVWMIRDDEEQRSGGQLEWRHLLNDIALGTGLGVRYNFDILVIRVDVGLGLHLPYETSKSGYFNVPRLSDGLGFHLAVGYPF